MGRKRIRCGIAGEAIAPCMSVLSGDADVSDAGFSPLNDLEHAFRSVRAGEARLAAFMDTLLQAQVFVLLDQDPGPEGNWHETASPLVLNNHQGVPVLAIFTAPERAIPMAGQFPAFAYGLLIDFAWLLQRITAGAGLVINPGTLIGMEMPPAAVQRLQQEWQAASRR